MAFALPFGRQVLSALLILATGSAETGLLVLNRYLLLSKSIILAAGHCR